MRVLGSQLLKIFSRTRYISSRYSRCFASACNGRFTTDNFCRQNDVQPVSRADRCQLKAASCTHHHPRRYCSLHKTQCDVHKFGELHVTVGSSCDVTISSLNPHVYLDQNLVIVDDVAQRLSVDCRSADDLSYVSLSESTDMKTSKPSGQQFDACDIQVPVKYGTSLCVIF